ncbi:hypothetical protein Tco_0248208 [Tanacetum coccineum]
MEKASSPETEGGSSTTSLRSEFYSKISLRKVKCHNWNYSSTQYHIHNQVCNDGGILKRVVKKGERIRKPGNLEEVKERVMIKKSSQLSLLSSFISSIVRSKIGSLPHKLAGNVSGSLMDWGPTSLKRNNF